MKILVLAGYTQSLSIFRGDLLREMGKRGHTVYAAAPEPDEGNELEQMGVSFMQVAMQRTATNPFSDLKLMGKYKALIRRIQPDVLFCYTVKPNVYGGMVGKRAGAKKVFLMVTGLGNTFVEADSLKKKLVQRIVKGLYKRAAKKSDGVIFQNPDDKEEFIKLGIVGRDKTHYVNGSGVNMEYFQASPLPEQPVFLVVSRLLKEKGVMEYLKAARLVKKQFPKSRMLLLGQYETHRNALKSADIAPYIEDGSIEYLGETKDVRPYYAQASVVVLPSYREGTPRTMLEAMACARPVITTDVPGCRETVIHGETGLLVPVQDVKALADAMVWMIEYPTERNYMGQAGLAYCREKYEVGKINKEMLRIMGL